MKVESLIKHIMDTQRRIAMADAEHFAIARGPIRYAPHELSAHDQALGCMVRQANQQVGTPIFCCHGKLARIQCKKCG